MWPTFFSTKKTSICHQLFVVINMGPYDDAEVLGSNAWIRQSSTNQGRDGWQFGTDFPQMVVNCKGNHRLFQGNLGWWNILIWPDIGQIRCFSWMWEQSLMCPGWDFWIKNTWVKSQDTVVVWVIRGGEKTTLGYFGMMKLSMKW